MISNIQTDIYRHKSLKLKKKYHTFIKIGAVEYTDCFSAEG